MNFVKGVKIYNKIVYSTDINYLESDKVCLMCHDYMNKTKLCDSCNDCNNEELEKLKELGFIIVDKKCCISYKFK